MPIERSSSAQWEGNLKDGRGTVSLGSGVFSGPYSFVSRFESGTDTNPEELIAAAQASCFAMAFSSALAKQGHPPTRVSAEATVTLDSGTITGVHVVCRAVVPGIDAETFERLAQDAKANCPISKVLAATQITLDATLEG